MEEPFTPTPAPRPSSTPHPAPSRWLAHSENDPSPSWGGLGGGASSASADDANKEISSVADAAGPPPCTRMDVRGTSAALSPRTGLPRAFPHKGGGLDPTRPHRARRPPPLRPRRPRRVHRARQPAAGARRRLVAGRAQALPPGARRHRQGVPRRRLCRHVAPVRLHARPARPPIRRRLGRRGADGPAVHGRQSARADGRRNHRDDHPKRRRNRHSPPL